MAESSEARRNGLLGLALAAAGLLGGFISHLVDFTDKYVTKELFDARMATVEAKIGGLSEGLEAKIGGLKDNIDALRAEVRAGGPNR